MGQTTSDCIIHTSLVGANTVKGPDSCSSSARPDSFSKLTSVEYLESLDSTSSTQFSGGSSSCQSNIYSSKSGRDQGNIKFVKISCILIICQVPSSQEGEVVVNQIYTHQNQIGTKEIINLSNSLSLLIIRQVRSSQSVVTALKSNIPIKIRLGQKKV